MGSGPNVTWKWELAGVVMAFFRRLSRVVRRDAPVLRGIARHAAPLVGAAVAGLLRRKALLARRKRLASPGSRQRRRS